MIKARPGEPAAGFLVEGAMPWAATKPCAAPRCGKLTSGRYCSEHQAQADERKARFDKDRGSAAQRGYDAAWRKVRDQHLRMEPLCRFCLQAGEIVEAKVVDHIQPIAERPDLRLDHDNLRSLCKPCHDSRTGRDQAWGRGRR